MPETGKLPFDQSFRTLTGNLPFPWQRELYKRFVDDNPDTFPNIVDLPTGVGKTSVIALWLLALINKPEQLPRRLVYVVNRRTVVDQTTTEVERLRENLPKLGPLWFKSLAISTLRGQFVDNQEWREDPSRPAVICGTVDMIGSRLLFGGYRIGFRSRPLHAGFLGQDALLVHDEAHLEPAFQALIESIHDEQKKEREQSDKEITWPALKLLELSATRRGGQVEEGRRKFELTEEERRPPPTIPDTPTEPIHHIWRRLMAKKSIHLHRVNSEKLVADKAVVAGKIAELAVKHRRLNVAVLIFTRTIDDMKGVHKILVKKPGVSREQVRLLTGTMRGLERDKLVKQDPVFSRFLPPSDRSGDVQPTKGRVYLISTSAGEVGVNLSADHMVCDLSTFESMAQRLGRVNRFGDRDDTRINVVHPAFDDKKPNPQRRATLELHPQRRATLELLKQLNGDASPIALNALPSDKRSAAFAPKPAILPATDILFDAWALTTIRGQLPGRPPVDSYLHGVAEWEPPRTSVAWREEVDVIGDELISREGEGLLQELLGVYPLKPHELLNDLTDRVYKELDSLNKNTDQGAKTNIWLVDGGGTVTRATLAKLMKAEKEEVTEQLKQKTVLLPPSIGGLTSDGMLDGKSKDPANDVSDQWLGEDGQPRRGRVWGNNESPVVNGQRMALIQVIDTDPLVDEFDETNEDEIEPEDGGDAPPTRRRFWYWYVRPRDAEEATRASDRPIRLEHHSSDVANHAKKIVEELKLPDELQRCIIVSAELHDVGKRREIWQRSIGNPRPTDWYAKPGKPEGEKRWRPRHLSGYRHELGSLLDVLNPESDVAHKFSELGDDMQDLALHLIAAHHGYARPHFPTEAYDHEGFSVQCNEEVALEVMHRYARLQRRYGRWGLAYLESLVRAADWAASANPSEATAEENGSSV